jgi:hypothetical protein
MFSSVDSPFEGQVSIEYHAHQLPFKELLDAVDGEEGLQEVYNRKDHMTAQE